MSKLPKFTLLFNVDKNSWDLKKDNTDRTVKRFDTKEAATKRNALRKAVGVNGGSIKIQKVNGKYQEERTFPKSADPKRSKG